MEERANGLGENSVERSYMSWASKDGWSEIWLTRGMKRKCKVEGEVYYGRHLVFASLNTYLLFYLLNSLWLLFMDPHGSGRFIPFLLLGVDNMTYVNRDSIPPTPYLEVLVISWVSLLQSAQCTDVRPRTAAWAKPSWEWCQHRAGHG